MDVNIDESRPRVYEAGQLKYHIEVVLLGAVRAHVEAAVMAERARCAKIVEDHNIAGTQVLVDAIRMGA